MCRLVKVKESSPAGGTITPAMLRNTVGAKRFMQACGVEHSYSCCCSLPPYTLELLVTTWVIHTSKPGAKCLLEPARLHVHCLSFDQHYISCCNIKPCMASSVQGEDFKLLSSSDCPAKSTCVLLLYIALPWSVSACVFVWLCFVVFVQRLSKCPWLVHTTDCSQVHSDYPMHPRDCMLCTFLSRKAAEARTQKAWPSCSLTSSPLIALHVFCEKFYRCCL